MPAIKRPKKEDIIQDELEVDNEHLNLDQLPTVPTEGKKEETVKRRFLMKAIFIKKVARVVRSYKAKDDDEISVKEGEEYEVIGISKSWVKVKSYDGNRYKVSNISANCCEIQRQFGLWFHLSILLALFVAAFGFTTYQEKKECPSLHPLMNKWLGDYMDQPDFVASVHVCLERTKQENIPCTLLLLHNGNSNERWLNALLENVAKVASTFLMAKDNHLNHTGHGFQAFLKKKAPELTVVDYVKSMMTSAKVMVISGLESMDSRVASQFHSVCDEYDPVLNEIAVIFTLKDLSHGELNPMTRAKFTLMKLWDSKLPDNVLDPLIVRLSSYVTTVEPSTQIGF